MNGNSPPIANLMAALEEALQNMPIAEIPRLRGELKRLDATAELRMLTGSRPEPQRETTNESRFLTAQEVAQRLNRKRSFVYEMARQRKLKSVKQGEKYVMFTDAAIQDFLANGGA